MKPPLTTPAEEAADEHLVVVLELVRVVRVLVDKGDGLVDGAGEGGVVEGEEELDAADGLGGCVGRGDLAGLPGVAAEVEGDGVAERVSEREGCVTGRWGRTRQSPGWRQSRSAR